MIGKTIYFLPALGCAVAIFLLSTLFGAKVPNPVPELISTDKLGHALAYFVLAGSLSWGLWKQDRLYKYTWWWVLLATVGYGMALEILQFSVFPNRYFEW
jgi:VanZ family protein